MMGMTVVGLARLEITKNHEVIDISDSRDNSEMNKAISEQILLYYNKYLHSNGFITEKEYHQMNARITSYIKNMTSE